MTDLTDLLARVEASVGPDRELDAAIGAGLKYTPEFSNPPSAFIVPTHLRVSPDGLRVELWAADRCHGSRDPFPVTGSLDAAVALMERVLPGWGWVTRTDRDKGAFAHVMGETFDRIGAGEHALAYAATPGLALLAAILRTLVDRERGNG